MTEESQKHWPPYALITFGLSGTFALGAVASFALMHVGRVLAQTYAMACTITAVVIYAATVVCLKQDQGQRNQAAILAGQEIIGQALAQILGHSRMAEHGIERVEDVAAGLKTTGLAALQNTHEAARQISNVGTRITELTEQLMAHRERTAVIVAEIREEYHHTLNDAVEAIRRDIDETVRRDIGQLLSVPLSALRGQLAEVEAKYETLERKVAESGCMRLELPNDDVYELGRQIGREEAMRERGEDDPKR